MKEWKRRLQHNRLPRGTQGLLPGFEFFYPAASAASSSKDSAKARA